MNPEITTRIKSKMQISKEAKSGLGDPPTTSVWCPIPDSMTEEEERGLISKAIEIGVREIMENHL